MLYETLLQANIFLSIMYFGIICGLCYEIFNLFKIKNYVLNIIKDFVFMLVFSCIFILSVNIFCFGEFRFYTILAFLVGFFVERKTIGKFVALFLKLVYNIYVKAVAKLKSSKILKFLKMFVKKLNFVKLIKIKLKKKKGVNNEGVFPV